MSESSNSNYYGNVLLVQPLDEPQLPHMYRKAIHQIMAVEYPPYQSSDSGITYLTARNDAYLISKSYIELFMAPETSVYQPWYLANQTFRTVRIPSICALTTQNHPSISSADYQALQERIHAKLEHHLMSSFLTSQSNRAVLVPNWIPAGPPSYVSASQDDLPKATRQIVALLSLIDQAKLIAFLRRKAKFSGALSRELALPEMTHENREILAEAFQTLSRLERPPHNYLTVAVERHQSKKQSKQPSTSAKKRAPIQDISEFEPEPFRVCPLSFDLPTESSRLSFQTQQMEIMLATPVEDETNYLFSPLNKIEEEETPQ